MARMKHTLVTTREQSANNESSDNSNESSVDVDLCHNDNNVKGKLLQRLVQCHLYIESISATQIWNATVHQNHNPTFREFIRGFLKGLFKLRPPQISQEQFKEIHNIARAFPTECIEETNRHLHIRVAPKMNSNHACAFPSLALEQRVRDQNITDKDAVFVIISSENSRKRNANDLNTNNAFEMPKNKKRKLDNTNSNSMNSNSHNTKDGKQEIVFINQLSEFFQTKNSTIAYCKEEVSKHQKAVNEWRVKFAELQSAQNSIVLNHTNEMNELKEMHRKEIGIKMERFQNAHNSIVQNYKKLKTEMSQVRAECQNLEMKSNALTKEKQDLKEMINVFEGESNRFDELDLANIRQFIPKLQKGIKKLILLQGEREKLEDSDKCQACWDRKSNVLILDCKHLVLCNVCEPKNDSRTCLKCQKRYKNCITIDR